LSFGPKPLRDLAATAVLDNGKSTPTHVCSQVRKVDDIFFKKNYRPFIGSKNARLGLLSDTHNVAS
jgi:hypothetical protein